MQLLKTKKCKPDNFWSQNTRNFISCRCPHFNFAGCDSFLKSYSRSILYSCEASLEDTVAVIIYVFDWNYLTHCVISYFLYRSQSFSFCRFWYCFIKHRQGSFNEPFFIALSLEVWSMLIPVILSKNVFAARTNLKLDLMSF